MGASATVKGGLFPEVGVSTLTQVSGYGPGRRRMSQMLARLGGIGLRERMYTLDGVVAGSTAQQAYARVEANTEQGGKRTIETVYPVNRATTADDITEINASVLNSLTSRTTFGASGPANKD